VKRADIGVGIGLIIFGTWVFWYSSAYGKTVIYIYGGFFRMVIAIGMCIGYLFLMQVIGFAMGTSVFLFVLMTFLGQQGLMKRIMSSIATSLVVWAIFRYFLVIPLPMGLFDFTF